ncbi:hypothetical protein DITRI_Ditri09bG0075000 [Diplodiscus trichospermus]
MATLVGLSCLLACTIRLKRGNFPFVGLLSIFLSIQVLVCLCSSDYKNVPECNKPFECGIIQDLSYPFRQRGSPEYCGKPGFDLYCEDFTPMITFGPLSYQVLVFNTALTVAPVKGVENMICTLLLVNQSLDLRPFQPAWNTKNITLYYDCPKHENQSIGLSDNYYSCNINEINIGAYVMIPSAVYRLSAAAKDVLRSCSRNILIPAFASILQVLEHNPSRATLDVTLANGFALSWSEDDSPIALGSKSKIKLIRGLTVGVAIVIVVFFSICSIVQRVKGEPLSISNPVKLWQRKMNNNASVEEFITKFGSLAPKRYLYSDIKKMTNKFKDKLGQGGYGSVYKGKLLDGRFVAVKVLTESKGKGEEFVNEVATIGRTSHVNVVTLLGFCFDRSKRALIYEFMPNGSLDKFIYNQGSQDQSRRLEWKTLLEIALGIARGLEYLHQGCNTRILHFDIKPHNILLDDNFYPKISDFGLSKFCERKESIISMTGARGTAGYIAPELFFRNFGGVSHKSDVYSYGMMVLEMVGGRKNIDLGVSETSEIYFPSWIYKHIDEAMNTSIRGVKAEEEEEITRRLTVVSLWCIQTNPADRPSMTKVIEMLQGSLQSLVIPPRPFLSSPVQVRSPTTASTNINE